MEVPPAADKRDWDLAAGRLDATQTVAGERTAGYLAKAGTRMLKS